MGVSKYVSDVKFVNQNHEIIYRFLSDFNNLGAFINEATLSQIAEKVPDLKIESFDADADGCRFLVSKYGDIGLDIVNREPTKMIKISGSGNMPMSVDFWIQILPVSPYQSKIRLTLHADLNMVMKMMLGKKLKEGINKFAEMLTMLPYR